MLFMREHKCRVRSAEEPPAPSWCDDQVFNRAWLVVAAPARQDPRSGMDNRHPGPPGASDWHAGNWFGLAKEGVRRLFGRLSGSDLIGGIPGSAKDDHTAPYSMTEKFVVVYRMHPSSPTITRSGRPEAIGSDNSISWTSPGLQARGVMERFGPKDLLYSVGVAHPGAVTLHNHPRFMQQFTRDDGLVIDLGAVDILRSRERDVERNNEFRRLMHLPPSPPSRH